MNIVLFVVDHASDIVAAGVSLLSGVIAVALVVPGTEPEATLKKVLDFVTKFSRK